MPLHAGNVELGARAAEIAIFALVAGVGLYFWGWRALRRRWMMRGMPTSKARSVAMGLAELKGNARSLAPSPRLSPVRQVPCVWSHVKVVRHVQSGKSSSATVLLDREVREPFVLEDDTGRVMVLPEGADISGVELTNVSLQGGWGKPPEDVAKFCDMNGIGWRINFFKNVRFEIREWALLADAATYVLGEAATLTNVADETHRSIVGKLKALIKDPAKKAEADSNRDGIIQQEEWDAAKEKAGEEAMKEQMAKHENEAPQPQVVMRRPKFHYFIIASGDENTALKAQGNPALLLGGGIAAIVLGIWLMPGGSWASPLAWISGGVVLAGSLAGPLFRALSRR